MSASVGILKALAVTAELTGTQVSPGAAKVMAADLAPYPENQVLGALARCRKELKGRLTVADVVQRLDDGRPGPEAAWAMIPRDEASTVVWTEEMAASWGVALPLLDEGDQIAARMAFLEHYRAAVLRARDAATPVKWMASFGTDVEGRRLALEAAVAAGRITMDRAAELGFAPHGSPLAIPAAKELAKRLALMKHRDSA